MSSLTLSEKRKLERDLEMGGGYVLGFSNRTFAEFIEEIVRIDIFNDKYEYGSGSKANRFRAFWDLEPDHVVASVLEAFLEDWNEYRGHYSTTEPSENYHTILKRLKSTAPVQDLEALDPMSGERGFSLLVKSIRASISNNEPQVGLDRLHTYITKYLRILCAELGAETTRDVPLHSLMGQYIKALKKDGALESEVTERILKSSISVLDAFNSVRNNQSYAHDNEILNYDESLLVFNHVCSVIKFIQSIEKRLGFIQ